MNDPHEPRSPQVGTSTEPLACPICGCPNLDARHCKRVCLTCGYTESCEENYMPHTAPGYDPLPEEQPADAAEVSTPEAADVATPSSLSARMAGASASHRETSGATKASPSTTPTKKKSTKGKRRKTKEGLPPMPSAPPPPPEADPGLPLWAWINNNN
jgi:hypothetical protein